MAKILFPSWRYHATESACIVQNEAESDALGPGWSNTPGGAPDPVVSPVVDDPAEPKKPKKPTK